MGLQVDKLGFRSSVLLSSESKLRTAFGLSWKDVAGTVTKVSECRKVDVNWLWLLLAAEVDPVDGSGWPRSWKTSTRVVSWLEKLYECYWDAMRTLVWGQVDKVLEDWNGFADMSLSKAIRVIGAPVRCGKVYFGGKYFKDILVLAFLLDRDGVALVDTLRNVKTRCKELPEEWTPRFVWKWNQYQPTRKVKKVVVGKLIEVG